MIYMQTYWTKVDHTAEPMPNGWYPAVHGTYLKKGTACPYDWKNIREFIAGRGTWHDYIGPLFDGCVFKLGSHVQITSFQLFRNSNKFPEVIEAPWLREHIGNVMAAWHERQTVKYAVYRSGLSRLDDSEHEKIIEYEASIKKLADLQLLQAKDLEEES